ncbi:MAG: hypothetical protein LC687_03835, partial [Actinobacteria bacterium]|nr:hypothetical protein [Actinomycetota bacterium]
TKTVDSFWYNSLIIVRVEHPSQDEANYDPFYSVNPQTGEVSEFSILTDGDPVAIMAAWEKSRATLEQ